MTPFQKGLFCIGSILTALLCTQPMLANTPPRQWNTDPFRTEISVDAMIKDSASIPQTDVAILNGIVKTSGRYRAMIDATMHKEGDYVGEYRIQKIVSNRVFLSNSRGIIFRLEFDAK